jgi:hypothetical protein
MKVEGGRMKVDCRPLSFFLTRATKVVRFPWRLPDFRAVKKNHKFLIAIARERAIIQQIKSLPTREL